MIVFFLPEPSRNLVPAREHPDKVRLWPIAHWYLCFGYDNPADRWRPIQPLDKALLTGDDRKSNSILHPC